MDEAAAKVEQGFFGVAVLAVLLLGVVNRLVRPGVLEFHGGDRHAVDEQHHVDGKAGVAFGVVNLPGHREDIAIEVLADGGVGVVVGEAVEQGKVGIVDRDALFQHRENAVFFDPAVKALQDDALPVGLILHLGQFFGLGSFEEAPELVAIDGKLPIKVSGVALFVAGTLHQCGFNAVFERLFVGLADHDTVFFDFECKNLVIE